MAPAPREPRPLAHAESNCLSVYQFSLPKVTFRLATEPAALRPAVGQPSDAETAARTKMRKAENKTLCVI